MTCKNCGSENPSDAKFCAGCGVKLGETGNPGGASAINNTPTVTFGFDCFLETLKERYAKFNGRATRTEFWCFLLFNFLLVWLGLLIGAALSVLSVPVSLAVYAIAILATMVPSLAISVRRLHDTGRSGWWYLINFIPYIGLIIFLVLCCLKSEPIDNKYGRQPK